MGHRVLNLLTKDDWRAALADERLPYGPEVALVLRSAPLSPSRERLARARPRPAFEVLRPREPQGEGPPPDPRKEVALGVTPEIVWLHVRDASLIYVPLWDKSLVHEFPQPSAGRGVVLVVVHAGPHTRRPAAAAFFRSAFAVPHCFFRPAFEGAAVSTSLPPPS